MNTRPSGELPVKMLWAKFSWDSWQNDKRLKMCSFAARGLWIDMLCFAASEAPYGHVTMDGLAPSDRMLATAFGMPVGEYQELLTELIQAGVVSRVGEPIQDARLADIYSALTDQGVFGEVAPGTLFSRRMVRDLFDYRQNIMNGRKGGNPGLTGRAATLKPRRVLASEGGVNPPLNAPVKAIEILREEEERVPASLAASAAPDAEGTVAVTMAAATGAGAADVASADRGQSEAGAAAATEPAKGKQGDFFGPTQPSPAKLARNEQARRLCAITGLINSPLFSFLGELRQRAGDDDGRLNAILTRCEEEVPAEPKSWLIAAAEAAPPSPRLVVNNDPNDDQGIQAWCRASGFQPTESERDRSRGNWVAFGKIVDRVAKETARAARLPAGWRGDWNVMAGWLQDGIRPADFQAVISSMANGMADYRPPASLKFFDRAVRMRAAA